MSTSFETTTDDFDTLRKSVAGRLITPRDEDWEQARTPWVVNVAQQPVAVLEIADVQDVVTAVTWAADHGTAVSAQPNGHGARRALDGTLLLRTRALDSIEIDLDRSTARVGAGVKWGELLDRLDGTGLVALAGSNPDPTVVGVTLGGGASWFSRKYGLTANSVISIDVVDATGTHQNVTRASDPELFWALRGGGGDFGIVVSIEIALFPGPELYGGLLMWPVEHASAVLRTFRDLTPDAPPELTMWAHILHFPPMPEVPEQFRGRSFTAIASTFLGPEDRANEFLGVLREAAPVEMDLMGEVPISRLGDVAAEPTDPMPAMEHSMLLDALDDEAIDALVAAAGDPQASPLAIVQIRHLGGAFADDSPAHGAAGSIKEPFQLFALGVPAVPELAAAIPHGFDAIDRALSHVASARRMPNFVGEGQDNASGYDPGTLARLQQVKQSRDPHGLIRSNKPVLS